MNRIGIYLASRNFYPVDAKNIFIVCQHYKSLIQWEWLGDTEWQYVGIKNDYNEGKVSELINSHFSAQMVYLVIDRHNAYEIDLERVPAVVGEVLRNKELPLSNKDFSKMMEFNRIGVVKKGRETPSLEPFGQLSRIT